MKKDKKDSLEKNTKNIKNEKKKVEKVKKKNIFSMVAGYFKGVKKEISRIRWTKGKELGKYSIAAVTFILFFCVYFYVIDILMAWLGSSL